jgi:hypothetical protein
LRRVGAVPRNTHLKDIHANEIDDNGVCRHDGDYRKNTKERERLGNEAGRNAILERSQGDERHR